MIDLKPTRAGQAFSFREKEYLALGVIEVVLSGHTVRGASLDRSVCDSENTVIILMSVRKSRGIIRERNSATLTFLLCMPNN